MTTTHVMLDLETVSKLNTAAVMSIGAVAFNPNDPDTPVENGDKFHVRCDLAGQEEFGLSIDGDTVAWWLDDNRTPARQQINTMAKVDIASALAGLSEWMDALPGETLAIWGNGPTFDNAILLNAYRKVRVLKSEKWNYKADRCYRTMRSFAGVPPFQDYGTAHGALDDAIAQAKHLTAIVAKFGITL